MENSFFFYAGGKLKPTQICVPLLADGISSVIKNANEISAKDPDLIEWRVDGVWDYNKDLKACADAIEVYTKEIPLLFTWRTHRDGGRQISDKDYSTLIKWAISSEIFSIVDIELSFGEEKCKELIAEAQNHGIETILSHHNFTQTPTIDEILSIYKKMHSLNSTAGKIAVMPNSKADVINLINANLQFKELHPNYPTIAIAMGALGAITRVASSFCESAFTFATVTQESAPGQLSIDSIRGVIPLT